MKPDNVPFKHSDVDDTVNRVAASVVDAVHHVRRELGAGLLERVYHVVLAEELRHRGHSVDEHVRLGLAYRRIVLERAYEIDLLVDGRVVVEVKAARDLHPTHHAQLLTYLRLSGHPLGLLVNFHAIPLPTASIEKS